MVTVIPKIITTPYPRTRLPMYLYLLSIVVSCSLLYWNLLYCKNYDCVPEKESRFGPNKHLLQYFPVLAAPIIIFISMSWFIIAIHYSSSACVLAFNFMEMPSAVFCSMLGGVSSVIEIHFSIDVVNVEWTDQWLLSSFLLFLLLNQRLSDDNLMRPAVKKQFDKRNGGKGREQSEEIGIPTVFTPVPSEECSMLREQSLRRFRDQPPLTSEMSSDTKSEKTNSVPTEIKKSTSEGHQYLYPPFDTRELARMALIRVYFMQNLFISFEISTDRTLQMLLRYVIKDISKEIRNKFSFYVFYSPYDVIWKRPRCELMKRPPQSTIFRQILTPSQMNLTLSELFKEMKNEGLDTMNVYIFVKDMDDTIAADEVSLKHKSWKYQQIID